MFKSPRLYSSMSLSNINLIPMILDLVCVKCCHSSHQCLQYTIKLKNPKLLSLHFLRSNFCPQPLLPKNFAHAGLVPRQSAAPKQKTAKSKFFPKITPY